MQQEEQELEAEFYGQHPRAPAPLMVSFKNFNQYKKLNSSQSVGSTTPMSPGKRILYVAGSPARFIKTQVKPGSTNASVFSLVIVCLGAGTLTFPYVIYENGFMLGIALILFGGLISVFTGYMIIYCIDQTKATCFEEIALACFNKRWQRFTSVCMIACNVGFTTSYFVLVSQTQILT